MAPKWKVCHALDVYRDQYVLGSKQLAFILLIVVFFSLWFLIRVWATTPKWSLTFWRGGQQFLVAHRPCSLGAIVIRKRNSILFTRNLRKTWPAKRPSWVRGQSWLAWGRTVKIWKGMAQHEETVQIRYIPGETPKHEPWKVVHWKTR